MNLRKGKALSLPFTFKEVAGNFREEVHKVEELQEVFLGSKVHCHSVLDCVAVKGSLPVVNKGVPV